MDIKNKKTVLNDEAALYTRDKSLTEKEKWENMTAGQKWEHFKSYYLMKIIVTTICVVLIGSLIKTMLTPKPDVRLSVAVIDHAMLPDTMEQVQKEFDALIGIDPEKEETLFDNGYSFSTGMYESFQKFSMYNAVGELDVTIMPQSIFEEYAPGGFFSPVTEHLPADLYSDLSDYLLVSKQRDEEGNLIPESETVYGICLDSTWPFASEQREESIVLSINLASANMDNVERFLRFLFFPENTK